MSTKQPKAKGRAIIARFTAALPGTLPELAERSGLSASNAAKWGAWLRKQELVHVGGYRLAASGTGRPLLVLVAGAGRDAPSRKQGGA